MGDLDRLIESAGDLGHGERHRARFVGALHGGVIVLMTGSNQPENGAQERQQRQAFAQVSCMALPKGGHPDDGGDGRAPRP
jgi:hypothetical protein